MSADVDDYITLLQHACPGMIVITLQSQATQSLTASRLRRTPVQRFINLVADEVFSLDFVSDALACSRKFRVLAVRLTFPELALVVDILLVPASVSLAARPHR